MSNIFDSIQVKTPDSNVFDLSHDVKMSFNMGYLYPTCAIECVPGDKFTIGCEALTRFSPLVSPVMHRSDESNHYFFVPNRLLWPNWENFITNTPVGGLLPAAPYIRVNPTNYTKFFDYLGLPLPAVGKDYDVSALPMAAYQFIVNEYYRDQNLMNELNYGLVDGFNNANTDLFDLRQRAWEHDYFTSALPFAQKGSPVTMPLGDVVLKNQSPLPQGRFERSAGGNPIDGIVEIFGGGGGVVDPSSDPITYDPNGSLEVGATTINDLRRAYALQRWLEKQARGGSRYVEQILMQFGVRSSDARLNRPEFITGTKSPITISEVLSTADTSASGGTEQGNMAGHGLAVTSGKFGKYFVEEHGYIIGIKSVMPKTAYQQGIPKHFLKLNDPFQYYWPDFAHIGEQEILNKELYVNHSLPNDTFGYTPRYVEYKNLFSRVAGEFKTTLKHWHIGRIFDTEPNLNAAFIRCDPRKDIFAVTSPTVDNLYSHTLHRIKAVRKMPKFGTPM